MPELPEVETVRRGLEPALAGHVIVAAQIRRPDLRRPFPPDMAARLTGRRVGRLRRRSKYILADLDSGESLLIHLGMSGRVLVTGSGAAPPAPIPSPGGGGEPFVAVETLPSPLVGEGEGGGAPPLGIFHRDLPTPAKHDHVILDIEGGGRVTFNDPRRFGLMDLVPTAQAEAHPLLAGLGPEPLGNGFHAAYLALRFRDKATPVKAALLDQRIVAGLGNIYVSEALHRAGISPLRAAGRISAERLGRLVPAIRQVLDEAIAAGGSSLRDYRQADGELGYFQHAFRVYDREGVSCPTPGCGGTVRRVVQSGRSSFYCPVCQR